MPEYRFTKHTHPTLRERIRAGEGREIPDAVRQMVERLPGRFVRFQKRYYHRDKFEWTELWLAGDEAADREAREWIDYLRQLHEDDNRKLRRISFARMTWKEFTNYCKRSLAKENLRAVVPIVTPPPPRRVGVLA